MSKILVICDDRPGVLAEVTTKMADKNINIDFIEGSSSQGFGFIRLEVDQYDLALKSLLEEGLEAITEEVIPLLIKDEPGSLAKVALKLKNAEINVNNLKILRRRNSSGKYSLVGISTDQQGKAIEVLKEYLVS